MEEKGFGPHLLVDAYGCDKDTLWNEELINAFIIEGIALAGMKLILGPFSIEYHGTIEGDEGVTSIAVLGESHFSLHGFPEREGFVTIDLYSCRDFDPEALIQHIKDTFNPTEVDWQVIRRGTKFKRA